MSIDFLRQAPTYIHTYLREIEREEIAKTELLLIIPSCCRRTSQAKLLSISHESCPSRRPLSCSFKVLKAADPFPLALRGPIKALVGGWSWIVTLSHVFSHESWFSESSSCLSWAFWGISNEIKVQFIILLRPLKPWVKIGKIKFIEIGKKVIRRLKFR